MANQIDNDAKVIAGDDYGFGYPAICRLSNTVMLAAHINESDELEIHKSIDDGLNWVLKKSLPNASGSFNFAPMTSTKAGIVYQLNNNEFEVWVTTDAGENWTNKLDITDVNTTYKSILLCDTTGRLQVIWISSSNYKQGKYSNDDGDNWLNWYINPFNHSASNLFDADINPTNNYIRVCWTQSGDDNNVNEYDSTGHQIGGIPDYGDSFHTYHDGHIAIDSAGNWYFAYVERTIATLKEILVIRRNGGSEINLYAPDTDNIIIKGSSSIGIDEDDNVFIYYTKTSDEKTYYRKYDAGTATWETEIELIAVANNRINCEKHILALSNKLHFVYYQAP